MRPLDGTGALLQGVQRFLRLEPPAAGGARAPDPPREAPTPPVPRRAPSLSTLSPQAIIRQAQLLLQITATAAASPAMRQIAAAAYQMELDARRDMALARLEGMTAGRQWLA